MGAYRYIQETMQKNYKERDTVYKNRIIAWRREPIFNKVEHPTNLTRARRLGFKAKQGYIVVRTRIRKGRRKRRKPMGGRKPRHAYMFVQPQLSHQGMAEQRINRAYKNMEVLNSYWVGEDGEYKFFETILVDPEVVTLTSIARKGRTFRGLTSVGRKARGLGRGRQGTNKPRVRD